MNPREWITEKVTTFVRSLDLLNVFSLPEIKCCMLEWMTGVDIVFFTLSLNDSFYLVRSQKNRFFSRTHARM